MKLVLNILFYLLLLLLICVILYPHTRFAYQNDLDYLGSKSLNTDFEEMNPGDKFYLRVFGVKRIASYKTSNFRVATVSDYGLVIAHQCGTAIITVSQGDEDYECKVVVVKSDDSEENDTEDTDE